MGLLAAMFWASAAIFYRKGLEDGYDPKIANFFRAPLGFLVLFLLCVYTNRLGDLSTVMSDYSILLIITIAVFIMNILGDILYLVAIQKVGVSIAYPLSYTYPLAVALISSIILSISVHNIIIVGTIISLVGIYVMSKEKIEDKNHQSIGILAALGASLSWATGIVIYSILLLKTDPLTVGTIKLAILMFMSSPVLMLYYKDKTIKKDKRPILFVLVGGLFGVGLGDVVFYISLDNISAPLASALTTSAPFLSQILACIFLKEKITKNKITGTILIVLGIIIILSPTL